MSLDEKVATAKLRQKKGEFLEEAEKAGINPTGTETTEYAKSAKLIVEKMHAPIDFHDKQLHSNIPKPILTNIMMLTGIGNAMEGLTDADITVIDEKKKQVTLLNIEPDKDPEKPSYVPYRRMSLKAYRSTRYWTRFVEGFTENLLEELPAVDGGRAQDAVQEIASITNSDRALIEAQNSANSGIFRKAYNITFGKGNKK